MTSAAIASIATIQQPQEVCVDVLLEKYAKGAETSAQEIFARVAKAIAGNRKKGDLIAIEGRLHYTRWQDSDGNDRYGCEIIADRAEFY